VRGREIGYFDFCSMLYIVKFIVLFMYGMDFCMNQRNVGKKIGVGRIELILITQCFLLI
jgi:hypothetical protein